LPRDWDWELTKWSTGAVFHTHLLDASVSPLPILKVRSGRSGKSSRSSRSSRRRSRIRSRT